MAGRGGGVSDEEKNINAVSCAVCSVLPLKGFDEQHNVVPDKINYRSKRIVIGSSIKIKGTTKKVVSAICEIKL